MSPRRLQLLDGLLRDGILVLRLPDVAPLGRRPEHGPGPGEESRKSRFQNVDERFQVFRQTDEEVLVDCFLKQKFVNKVKPILRRC